MYSWMARIVFMASIAGRRARSERWGERTNDDEQQQAKRSSRKRMAQQAHVRLFLWRPRFGFRFFWCAACGCLLWFADRTRHTSATFLSCLARCRCVSGSSMASPPDLDVALVEASRGGRLDEIRSLLDQQANVNAADDRKYTPLHWASRTDNPQCVELLLDRRANVDAADQDNNTPLHWATLNGYHRCVDLLLDRRANVNAVGFNNDTPLHLASRYGYHQCVELLLANGASKLLTNVREIERP